MYLRIIITFFMIGFGCSSDEEKQRMKITIFTESYCPDCIKYTKEQLEPVCDKFPSRISLEFVPYGNADQWYENGHWRFHCQHGERECYGNKLQACAILEACGDQGSLHCTPDKLKQILKYITCVEASSDQKQASDQCARESDLTPETITQCASGDEGEYLLNKYGNLTEACQPKIEYVPSVEIDGVHSEAAEDNLLLEVCKRKPDWCEGPSAEMVS